ncbi:hypothetical protein HF086_009963 [Spodoptera exigua]|uniref:Uncharacterized protein n=1 Tax=Spodoptera exigua TaxID=7107 RepID=A0A922MU87_SPOEX|nr:hypothetical protein HF086_009963 [Spodoptera exigua]
MDSVTLSVNLKDREKERFSPTRWVSNKAMDVWYGNKSMVDIFSSELANLIEKIATRPGRSPDARFPHYLKLIVNSSEDQYENEVPKKQIIQPIPQQIQEGVQIISRVDINFINGDNETVHTIQLKPQADKKYEYLKALAKKKIKY